MTGGVGSAQCSAALCLFKIAETYLDLLAHAGLLEPGQDLVRRPRASARTA
jgi:hypothetical protein